MAIEGNLNFFSKIQEGQARQKQVCEAFNIYINELSICLKNIHDYLKIVESISSSENFFKQLDQVREQMENH